MSLNHILKSFREWLDKNIGNDVVFQQLSRLEDILVNIQGNQITTIETIAKNQEELMSKFSEYKNAVDATLESIMTTILSESEELQQMLENPAEIEAAILSMNEKRAKVIEAIQGLSTKHQSPTEPIEVPESPSEPLPVEPTPVEPPVETPVDTAPVDPEVPVEVTPSPDDVGVEDGFDVELA